MKNESLVELQILDYLAANPAAEDTLRGIVEWWLLKQMIATTTAEVEAALDSLVARGKLKAETGPDGHVRYGLRHARSENKSRGYQASRRHGNS